MDKVTELRVLEKAPKDISTSLEILDTLREDLVTGKIKAFTGVGVGADHSTHIYTTHTEYTSKLELMGAISALDKYYWEE